MNRLQYEKSPYLLQHAQQPVDWYPWGDEALERAVQENRLIFLSIGYSTCHWCHVMARESFDTPAVAQALQDGFVAIKVDREEMPDLDRLYMAACEAMTGSGGWPLNLLLTPDQKPFWAGTYLLPSVLLSTLRQARALWEENPSVIKQAGEELRDYLAQEDTAAHQPVQKELLDVAKQAFSRSFDATWGGFSRAPKFPMPHQILFLLAYARHTQDTQARHMATETLLHLYRGGIFDHVGGGFARYSTDAQYFAPHFEKTLYDNALLALSYAEAFADTKRPLYEHLARRTLEYLHRDLTDPAGACYCSQDADSDGVEGAYYLWTPEEIAQVCPEHASQICTRFGVIEKGNFHGSNILHLLDTPDWETEPEWLEACREAMRRYRAQRLPLALDDKVLTAWNGLAMAAFAQAGFLLDCAAYIQYARAIYSFLCQHLLDDAGLLYTRYRDGERAHLANLEDLAYLGWGLTTLYAADPDPAYLAQACQLADTILEHFASDSGGFYSTADNATQLLVRRKDSYDGALPSGNSIAALLFLRLDRYTGQLRYRQQAQAQLAYLAGQIPTAPQGHAMALYAITEALYSPGELVVAAAQVPSELAAFARGRGRGLYILLKTPDTAEALGDIAPFTRDYAIPQTGARYYLCQNGTCQRPVDSLKQLLP